MGSRGLKVSSFKEMFGMYQGAMVSALKIGIVQAQF
jgi:hypothetical protein